MYSVWCEWDIGQEDLIFHNKDDAVRWCEKNIHLKDIIELDENGYADVDEIIGEGLLGFSKLKFG